MIDFRRYTLPNGLRVVHNFDPGSVMLAVNVVYDTGARDETRDLTGIAHLFEHLMFGGSVNVPHFDEVLESVGGTSNAWTSNDFTSFYDILPAASAATALYLESDRMLGLAFDRRSLETQRKVVIEEFSQQCLNRPYGRMMHTLRAALYSAGHPYSWPVIGLEPAHIARVTPDDVRRWFYAHYAPDNAVLALSGNLPYDEGRDLVGHWFADIPARAVAPRSMPDPGFPRENILTTVHDPAVDRPMLVIAIPMDPYGTHDYRVTDCITDILSAGKSTRLYRNLVAGGDGTVIEADASVMGSEHDGFMMFTIWPAACDESTLARAEVLVMDQLRRLALPGELTDHELQRTLNRFETTFALQNYDLLSRAGNLAMAELHGEDINDTVGRQRAITTADVRRVAARLADTPRVTLRYLPAESPADTHPTDS